MGICGCTRGSLSRLGEEGLLRGAQCHASVALHDNCIRVRVAKTQGEAEAWTERELLLQSKGRVKEGVVGTAEEIVTRRISAHNVRALPRDAKFRINRHRHAGRTKGPGFCFERPSVHRSRQALRADSKAAGETMLWVANTAFASVTCGASTSPEDDNLYAKVEYRAGSRKMLQ